MDAILCHPQISSFPSLTSPYLPDKLLFSFQNPAFSRKPFLLPCLMMLVTPVSVSSPSGIFKAVFVMVLWLLKVGFFHFARPLERTDCLLYSGAWHGPSGAAKLLWKLTFLMEWYITKKSEAEGQSDSLDWCCIFLINLFIWLRWVLVAARRIFSCSMWGPVPRPEIESGPPELGAQS